MDHSARAALYMAMAMARGSLPVEGIGEIRRPSLDHRMLPSDDSERDRLAVYYREQRYQRKVAAAAQRGEQWAIDAINTKPQPPGGSKQEGSRDDRQASGGTVFRSPSRRDESVEGRHFPQVSAKYTP